MTHLSLVSSKIGSNLEEIKGTELHDTVSIFITIRALEESYRHSKAIPIFILKWKKVFLNLLTEIMDDEIFPFVKQSLLQEMDIEIEAQRKKLKEQFIKENYKYFDHWFSEKGFKESDECLNDYLSFIIKNRANS